MLRLSYAITTLLLTTSIPAAPQDDAQAGRYAPILTESGVAANAAGVWRARGYGWIASFVDGAIEIFDHSPAGTRPVDGDVDELLAWMGLFRRDGDVLFLTTTQETSTVYTLDLIDDVPPIDDLGEDPVTVFDYFCGVMEAHYAFFDLWGVDWAARRDRIRPTIDASTSEAELFEAMCAMLGGIRDDHLVLEAEIDGQRRQFSEGSPRVLWPALIARGVEQGKEPNPGRLFVEWMRGYKNSVAMTVLMGDYGLEADGRVVWGRIGDVGYLNVLSMGGFAESEDIHAEIAGVHDTMNKILGELADCDALIVDVTLNTGGYDEVQLAIASHFADERVPAFQKYPIDVRDDVEGVRPQVFEVIPAEGERFLGPVGLVTSDYTVSAGEDFSLAMRELPNVTHFGMQTRGAFSDVLEKGLPNGWRVWISNEVYLDMQGRHWEARGVPPQHPIAVFDPANLDESHAEAIFEIADLLMW